MIDVRLLETELPVCCLSVYSFVMKLYSPSETRFVREAVSPYKTADLSVVLFVKYYRAPSTLPKENYFITVI